MHTVADSALVPRRKAVVRLRGENPLGGFLDKAAGANWRTGLRRTEGQWTSRDEDGTTRICRCAEGSIAEQACAGVPQVLLLDIIEEDKEKVQKHLSWPSSSPQKTKPFRLFDLENDIVRRL